MNTSKSPRSWIGFARHLGLGLIATAEISGCAHRDDRPNWPKVGNPGQGKVEIIRSGCGSCHAIPGVQNADGLVGPPLNHFSRRTIIAGMLANTPEDLVRWVRFPQMIVPGNAMPDSGLDDQQARDVTAYLLTLR